MSGPNWRSSKNRGQHRDQAMREALGATVFFGMLDVAVSGLIFTPGFYVLCRWIAGKFKRQPRELSLDSTAVATRAE